MSSAAVKQTEQKPKTEQTFKNLPLTQIRVSAHNPRKGIDKTKLQELAESIKTSGVLEPILVRPVPPDVKKTTFEIVAGERRFRAASQAGLSEIPAIVRDLSAKQALEIAVVENLQREDLSPIEEAQGYQRLIDEHGYAAEDLGAKVGRSRAAVYARLKLLALPKEAVKALAAGDLTASVAELIARIPNPKNQKEATRDILEAGEEGRVLTFRAAKAFIQKHYMLGLSKAPFNTKDAHLVPKAGSCAACPNRTGNNPDLFGDVGRTDVCTDPKCYERKRDAAWKRTQAKASEAGQTVIPDNQARKLFYGGGNLTYNSDYVDLASPCDKDPQGRSWKRLLGKDAPEPILARDDAGQVHRLLKATDAAKALKLQGHDFLAKREQRAAKETAEQKREQEQLKRKREVGRLTAGAAIEAVVAKAETQEPKAAFWALAVESLAEGSWHETINTVVKRRGWAVPKGGRPEEVLLKQLPKLKAGQLRALMLEMLVSRDASPNWNPGETGKSLKAACAAYRVDLRKLRAAATKQVTSKPKTAPKATRK